MIGKFIISVNSFDIEVEAISSTDAINTASARYTQIYKQLLKENPDLPKKIEDVTIKSVKVYSW